MIPSGTFNVGQYKVYVSEITRQTVTVTLVDILPILQAERAATTVARLLKSSEVHLEKLKNKNRYACVIKDVQLEEVEKWH